VRCCGREMWVVAEAIYDIDGKVFRRVLRCPTCEDWRLELWRPPAWINASATAYLLLKDEVETALEALYPA
jgi:hypothetical protein